MTNSSCQAYPLKFRPIPQERIWGGHQLKAWFGLEHIEAPIGEYWILSGHPNATSTIINGPMSGKTLSDVVAKCPAEYLGRSPQPRFPLLIKYLEAADDLSVQVHPDDEYALKNEGDYGKTEAWYILGCRSNGQVVYGHHFPDKSSYQLAVAHGTVEDCLGYEGIQPGQVVFVPSRTLHALLAGTQVIEIQQTSDVTYRVYDWNRVDTDGKGRELHVEQAGNVLDYTQDGGQCESTLVSEVVWDKDGVLCERLVVCPYFTLERWVLQSGQHEVHRAKAGSPDILIGVSGMGYVIWGEGEVDLGRAETVLIPTTLDAYILTVPKSLEVLRVTY